MGSNKFLAVLSMLTVLTQCHSVQQHPNKTVIDWHSGGVVWQVYDELQDYRKPLQITGVCASSCTLAFEYKDTCVTPNARIMFHAPREPQTDSQGNIVISKVWFDIMLDIYPANIKPLFVKTLDGKDYWYTGAYLHQYHGVPFCY